MATFLDIGIFEFLAPAFIFILIFLLLYSFLQKTKLLGGKSGIDLMVSIVIGIVVMFSGGAVELIKVLTPWYVVMFVIIFILLLTLTAFGVKEEDALGALGGKTLVFVLGIVFLMIAISNVFGGVFQPYDEDVEQPYDEDSFAANIFKSVFHPRVLGAFVILLVVAFTVKKVHG